MVRGNEQQSHGLVIAIFNYFLKSCNSVAS